MHEVLASVWRWLCRMPSLVRLLDYISDFGKVAPRSVIHLRVNKQIKSKLLFVLGFFVVKSCFKVLSSLKIFAHNLCFSQSYH